MTRSSLISVAALVAALAAATLLPTYYASLATYAVVLALLGTAVNITVGYLGLISFGHAAFFGLGAYTAGLLAVKCGVNFWVATLVAILPGACLGALVGFASLRVRGPYFAISTLVTAEILRLIASNWISLTRGPLGVIVPRPRVSFLESFGLNFAQYHLIICIVALALVLEVLRRLLSSPYGRAWLALRDQQDLAESVGIVPLNHRVAAIALSGGIAALAGALLVPRILVLSPDLFGTTFSATGLLAAILGGKGTLIGPILGGIAFAVAPELLRAIDTYRIAVFALLLLVVVRVKPDGLAAFLPRSRPAPAPSAAVPPAGQSRTKVASLVVSDLSKHFGGLKAIDDVSFSVSRGKIVGLIGPNGAGKTTCLSLVSGFAPPTTGQISLGDGWLSGKAAAQVAAEGVVRTFQHTTLCPTLSAFENVLIGTHLVMPETPWSVIVGTRAFVEREAIRKAWAQACIETVGLTDRSHSDAGTLAYGEQRMLSIAVALAARPDFLLLDEPGAGLNATEAAALAALLRRLKSDGLTIVIIDHNLRMMMGLCDEFVVLHHGRKLAQGDPVAVRNDPAVVKAYLGEKRSGEVNAVA